MNHTFVILKTSEIHIDCHHCTNCPDLEKIAVKKGSVLTLAQEKKFVEGRGWYFLIDFSNEHQLYINTEDFIHYYEQELFCSLLDFELKYNYLKYKVNEALDERNAVTFNTLSNELKYMNDLRKKIEEELKVCH
ncbi:hypothetical protein [Bacillus suaedaesalsae]|uniref:IDEAL domain-containing protein n=1 Tax=Bacillus suaedaesalsae TaxID=2810349 RepID=A0ABS2DH90_9BACI|nr:hypothetical protein [Bacillus suaedaesalsae]MBM6617837.1 hypothetical protein [Bacillus suaedaesalsae]